MAKTIKESLESIESCGYVCDAGPLENNVDFMQLKIAADYDQVEENLVEVDEEDIYAHIEARLKEMGYTPDRDMIELVLELEFEYLQEKGIAETSDE